MNRFWLIVIMAVTGTEAFAQTPYELEIQAHRDTVNQEFADTATSILPKEIIDDFYGLPFYPASAKYLIPAKFRRVKGKPFEMKTSTSRLPVYRKYGVLKFKIDGERCKLFLYENVKASTDTSALGYVFLPFKDLSNQDSTYGGGRYLDFEIEEVQKRMKIDFNLCYNPYCAYNNRYSCPVPPKENRLDVRIDAGVKKWHH